MYVATRNAPGTADAPAAAQADETSEGPEDGSVANPTIVALGLTSFFTDLASEMVSAIFPLYLVTQVGFDVGAFGVFDGALAASTILLVLIGGSLADRRWRAKRVALGGYSVSAISRVGLVAGFAPVGFLLLDRVGKGLRVAPRDALIAAHACRDRVATSFAVHRMFDTAGALAGPLTAFVVLELAPADYGLIFQLSVLASIVGLVTLVAGTPAGPRHTVPPPGRRLRLRDFSCATHVRRVAAAGAVVGLVTISDGLLFLAIWRLADLSATVFPLLFVGTALSYLLFALPVGRLADRIGRARLLVPALAPLLVVYLLLVLVDQPTTGTVLLCLGLHGLYYAMTDGLFSATASAISPDDARGRSLATVMFGVAAGKLVGGALFGALWLRFGLSSALAAFAVGVIAAVLAVGMLLGPVVEREHT